MARTEISNSDNVIDSRDIIERIRDLEADADNGMLSVELGEAEELATLKALAEDAVGYVDDWTYGATLIRDSYFERYAEELADDLGVIDGNAGWPLYCIDWKRAADDLKMDYTPVDFDGVTYWVR